MTHFEMLALLLSAVAAVVAVCALVRTRKFQDEQNELLRVTASLSQKQIDRIEEDETRACRSRVRVTLRADRTGDHFVIMNEGPARAENVWITLNTDTGDNPLVPTEYADKIPIPFLAPGDEVLLIAAIHDGCSGRYTLHARWTNADGSQSKEDFFVSV